MSVQVILSQALTVSQLTASFEFWCMVVAFWLPDGSLFHLGKKGRFCNGKTGVPAAPT